MSIAYSIGISALNVGQRAIDLVGQNLSNATTPGYHRQAVSLTSKSVGNEVGSGVEISRFVRYSSPALRLSIVHSHSEKSRLAERLEIQRQAEVLFSTGSGSIDGRMEEFFNQVERLSTRPEDSSQRRATVDNASALANRFNELSADLTRLKSNVSRSAAIAVEEVNNLSPKIADLNLRIAQIEIKGEQANDLRDQREQYLNQLSGLVDVRITEQEYGIVNVIGANAPLVVGDQPTKLESFNDLSGALVVRIQGQTAPLPIQSGKLSAILQEHNTELPKYQTRLDQLARTLIEKVNQVQATGLGTRGPTTAVNGSVSVVNPTAPLATQNLAIPMQAGDLAVSITDLATGVRTLSTIAIDPATQSMQDVANAVTAGTGGQVIGSVEPSSQTLRFTAATGYSFDFAGRLPSQPLNVVMNGTAVPSVTGTYTGSGNDNFQFQVVGSGTIGTTPGLTMEVRNGAGSVIASLNVGQGYTAGTPLIVRDGINVRLSAGTTNAGSFEMPVTGNADTAGLTAALGMGGLFTGTTAGSIAVRAEVAADPALLAASRNGDIGDTSNLLRFSALRDAKVMSGGTQRMGEYFGDTVGIVGANVDGLSELEDAQTVVHNNLESQEQSLVGVDINEEMVNLLTYQRMVESASRYLSVVNRALDAVLEMAQ